MPWICQWRIDSNYYFFLSSTTSSSASIELYWVILTIDGKTITQQNFNSHIMRNWWSNLNWCNRLIRLFNRFDNIHFIHDFSGIKNFFLNFQSQLGKLITYTLVRLIHVQCTYIRRYICEVTTIAIKICFLFAFCLRIICVGNKQLSTMWLSLFAVFVYAYNVMSVEYLNA